MNVAELRLSNALSLLEQAGVKLPKAADGSAQWLQAIVDALCDLSSKDALTGLYNRRSFAMALSSELDRVARSGESALLLTMDIDHFKAINDSHGHAAGDVVIQAVARAVSKTIRPMDTAARIGGEEFSVVLPNCPSSFGATVAERIRKRVAMLRIDVGTGVAPLSVTISIGGAFAPQWVRSSSLIWMERADRQLYRAKSEGRNRACLEMPADSLVSAEERSLLFAMVQTDTLKDTE